MKRLVAALGAVVLVVLAVLVPGVGAQEGESARLRIRTVDTSDAAASTLVVEYGGAAGDLSSATIVENGEELRVASVEPLTGSEQALVIAVDTSTAMDQGGALVQTREAVAALIADAPEGQQIGLVSFGGTGRVVQRLTTDRGRLLAAVESLAPTGGSAVVNGVDVAAEMVATANGRERSIIVIAGGPNEASTVSGSRARGSVVNAKATVYTVALVNRGAPGSWLQSLADVSGGIYTEQENPASLVDALDGFADSIGSQHRLTFASGVESGSVHLTLSAGSASTSVSFVAGGVVSGASALQPVSGIEPGGVGFLRDNGLVIGIGLVLLAVALAIYAVISLMAPSSGTLDSVLEQYTEPTAPTFGDDDDSSALAKTALIQRAVSLTEGFAERQGFLATIEGMLERANLPLRAAEALFFYAAAVVIAFFLGIILVGGLLGGLIVALFAALVPPAVVNYLAGRRQKAFVAQLPDTLQLLSGTLRAGYSLMQGVEAVSREVAEPMGQELRRVVTESRLGRPLEESLEASAERMDSPDFSWAVMAVRIQREVGGNLGELLLTVADTMTQRERLRRDVDALTAEGKISAIVLGLLPVGLGFAMYMLNRPYIETLFNTTLGNFLLGGAIVLAGVGFYWMKKVIEVDI